MIFAVFTCISLALLGASWFLYRRNFELFLCLLLVIYFEFFYILPQTAGYKYLLLPMILILFGVDLIQGNLALGRYGWWVIGYFAISILGLMVAYFAGQEIVLGIKAAKFIPFVLIYFMVAGRKVDADKFIKYFVLMSLCVAFLAAICYFTNKALNPFLGMPKDYLADQIGRPRITIGQFVIASSAVMAFAAYRKGNGIWYLAAAAGLFAEIVVVQQTRGFIAGVFLAGIVVYIVSRPLTVLRLSWLITLLGLSLIAGMALTVSDLSKIGFFKRIESDLVKREGRYGGSLQARLNAYQYYWGVIENNYLVGRGLLNLNWQGNQDRYLRETYKIYLSDIGIMQFFVQTGLIGICWFIHGLYRCIKDALLKKEALLLCCYFILGTLTMPTLDMFLQIEHSLFLFVVILGITSSIILDHRNIIIRRQS